MTQKKKYYFCFALAISICMTVLIQVFRNRQIIMRSDIKLPQLFASWSNSL